VVIAGLYRGDDLVVVGRTVSLDPRQAAEIGKLLQPAKAGHSWPDEISSQRWGGKDSKRPLTKVELLPGAKHAPATRTATVRSELRNQREWGDPKEGRSPADVDAAVVRRPGRAGR
jgi:hypothetical protein